MPVIVMMMMASFPRALPTNAALLRVWVYSRAYPSRTPPSSSRWSLCRSRPERSSWWRITASATWRCLTGCRSTARWTSWCRSRRGARYVFVLNSRAFYPVVPMVYVYLKSTKVCFLSTRLNPLRAGRVQKLIVQGVKLQGEDTRHFANPELHISMLTSIRPPCYIQNTPSVAWRGSGAHPRRAELPLRETRKL